MSKERRQWKSDTKIKLLRRHLIEKAPSPTVCELPRLRPSLFRGYQEQSFKRAALALKGNKGPEQNQDEQPIETLEQKIRRKDEVLAELITEHISLKTRSGRTLNRCRVSPSAFEATTFHYE